MALWGKTDETVSQPKWLAKMNIPEGFEVIFVDSAEARVSENRARGIKTPGWWLYKSWENADGSVQHSAELLVAMSGAGTDIIPDNAGDADDDTIAADLVITIDAQPESTDITSPDDVTLTVEASLNGAGTLTYQWFNADDDTAVTGETSATLALTAVTAPASYYVVVSAVGAEPVQSDTADITESV